MTLLGAQQLAEMRKTFRADIHNVAVSVRLQLGAYSDVPAREGYETTRVQEFTELANFPCSYYQFLSGKTTRIFRSRLEEQINAAGHWNDTEWLFQYVPNLNEVLLLSSASTNAAPSATVLEDSTKDFTALGVAVGALVQNITDGSEALITVVGTTTLTTEALTGGTLDLYTAADAYRILNPTSLKVNDQVKIQGLWRTVLGVIPDSEGVQSTAMCSS